MILKQYYLACLAHASYMVGDENAKSVAIVDPQRDIEQYLDDAKALGVEIRHVLLTHFHADFVAGHLELQAATGATIHLGKAARADYEFQVMSEQVPLMVGDVRLEFLETPGHTPEGVCILAFDGHEDAPRAVFTGDTLFIGDVGRPDLMIDSGLTANDLAELMYDSLHEKLLKLPDETLVYPAHGAGSMCGKNLSTDTVSTIGQQRRHNYALANMSKAEFTSMLTADLPEAPAYFSYSAQRNQQKRPLMSDALRESLYGMSVEEVETALAMGAQLLDTRSPDDFMRFHWKDSVNIGLDGQFATWAGTLLDIDRPIVVLADAAKQEESAMRLGRIGFDHMIGYVDQGIDALATRPDLQGNAGRVDARALAELLKQSAPPKVLDVRRTPELSVGTIPNSLNIPLHELPGRLSEVPRDQPLVVTCAGGYRSAIATSLLRRAGIDEVTDLVGGFGAWRSSKM